MPRRVPARLQLDGRVFSLDIPFNRMILPQRCPKVLVNGGTAGVVFDSVWGDRPSGVKMRAVNENGISGKYPHPFLV